MGQATKTRHVRGVEDELKRIISRNGITRTIGAVADWLDGAAARLDRGGFDLSAKDVRAAARQVKSAALEIERLYA